MDCRGNPYNYVLVKYICTFIYLVMAYIKQQRQDINELLVVRIACYRTL